MNNQKTILVISFTNLASDPRIRRQIEFLRGQYQVVTLAAGPSGFEGVRHIDLGQWKAWKHALTPVRYLKWVGRTLRHKKWAFCDNKRIAWQFPEIRDIHYDLVIANDIGTMELARNLAHLRNVPILLDAHELEMWSCYENPDMAQWQQEKWKCQCLIPLVNKMIAVSPMIAEYYSKQYQVNCEVITNAPFFVDLTPSKTVDSQVRLVHHGGTNAQRHLDNMLKLMDKLDARFTLDLFLVPYDRAVYDQLRKDAEGNRRIRFQEPVQVEQISTMLNSYDLGIYMLPHAARNQELALPNKFFEFVQGRLGQAVWPNLEMAKLVRQYGLGIVTEDYTVESMAKALNALTVESIETFKRNAHGIAAELSADRNKSIFLRIIEEALSSQPSLR